MRIGFITTSEEAYFKKIQESIKKGEINASIEVLITNKPKSDMGSLGLRLKIVNQDDFKNRENHDLEIMRILDENRIDVVILGNYNRLIKNSLFLERYKKKIINIHHSYLPEFLGLTPEADALKARSKSSGFTFHYVDLGMDTGEIITQKRVNINDCETVEEVREKIVRSASDELVQIFKTTTFGKGSRSPK